MLLLGLVVAALVWAEKAGSAPPEPPAPPTESPFFTVEDTNGPVV